MTAKSPFLFHFYPSLRVPRSGAFYFPSLSLSLPFCYAVGVQDCKLLGALSA